MIGKGALTEIATLAKNTPTAPAVIGSAVGTTASEETSPGVGGRVGVGSETSRSER